ncbi:hypothetical protein P775_22270 [Puniceibacterium antarcticum]|uniref:Uncharacterized protein n=1 Tax=Puniceibacterium antarcticum TaxID=1206336 RepID=A0A2G8R8W4_9RHOB|nr:hypothetical protein P775_22270 [Puniceibacterium antarcticum]
MPQLDKLAMQAITGWPSLIAEMQTTSASAELLHQLSDVIGPVLNRPPVADLTTTPILCDCDRNCRLMDIQPNKRAIEHLFSPPFLRLGTSQSGATLERRMRGRGHRPSQFTPRSWGLDQLNRAVADKGLFFAPNVSTAPRWAG